MKLFEMHEILNEGSYTDSIQVELMDDDGNNETMVSLEVSVLSEPTEYDGPHVFYQGGVEIESIRFEHDFTFLGKSFQKGADFPAELLPFTGFDSPEEFKRHIMTELDIDENPDEHHYPDSRRY